METRWRSVQFLKLTKFPVGTHICSWRYAEEWGEVWRYWFRGWGEWRACAQLPIVCKPGVWRPRGVVLHVAWVAVFVPGPARSVADRSVFLAQTLFLVGLLFLRVHHDVPANSSMAVQGRWSMEIQRRFISIKVSIYLPTIPGIIMMPCTLSV